jgi:hypothetical protein
MNHEPDTIRDKFNFPFVIFRFQSIPCTSFGTVINNVKEKECWLKSSGMIFSPWCKSPKWTSASSLSRLHYHNHLDISH